MNSYDFNTMQENLYNASQIFEKQDKFLLLIETILGLHSKCSLDEIAENVGISLSKVESIYNYLQKFEQLQLEPDIQCLVAMLN